MSPLVWYRSDGFESAKGKGNKSNPADNWRWLHIMDPRGSVWHSTILAKANQNRAEHGAEMPPGHTHAYLPNRSREAQIAVMEIIAHRLRKAGVSFVRNQYDSKNVFPSVGRETLLNRILQMIRREEDEIAANKPHSVCMYAYCLLQRRSDLVAPPGSAPW